MIKHLFFKISEDKLQKAREDMYAHLEKDFEVKRGDIPSVDTMVEITLQSRQSRNEFNKFIAFFIFLEFFLAAIHVSNDEWFDAIAPFFFCLSLVMIMVFNGKTFQNSMICNASVIGMMCSVRGVRESMLKTASMSVEKATEQMEINKSLTQENEALKAEIQRLRAGGDA